MNNVREFLTDTLRRIYAPRSGLNAWQWGEKWVNIDSRESIDFQGPWDSSLTPYVRFVMEFVTGEFGPNVEFHPSTPPEAVWDEFIIMKSSQLGFTLALLIVIAFFIAEVKQNALYSIDSLEEARRISIARLQPLLANCKPTAAALDESEDEQSNLTLFLLSLTLYILGSHGKGAFRNKSVGLAILDELDAYKKAEAEGRSHPIDDARARLKAVGEGKLITSSTPETEEDVTAQEEKTGSRHRCFVPCPHCEHYQELTFEGLRFSHCKDLSGGYDLRRVELETFYECELCHKPISEDAKPEMLRRLRFRQTNPNPQPRKISLQMSDLYSPFKKASWGRLAVEFIEAQGNPVKLADFNKNRLGRPSKLQTDQRSPAHIDKLRGTYLRGTIPVEPCLVTVQSDVQGDVKKWVKLGWLPDGTCYVIDWGACLAFEELAMIAADPVPVGRVAPKSDPQRWHLRDGWEGPFASASIGLCDEGYIKTEVREFCQRTQLAAQESGGCLWFPSKGRGGIQVRLTVQESLTEALGLPLRAYHYSDDDIKKMLYISRIARRVRAMHVAPDNAGDPTASDPTSPTATPGPRLWFPLFVDAEFKGELCSERLVIVREGGFSKEEWQKAPSVPNDWGDALKLGLVIWHFIGSQFADWKPASETDATEASDHEAAAA